MLLRSVVVDHLQNHFNGQNVAVLCIYCNYKKQDEQTVSELVASLLKQLVQDRSVTSDQVKTLYKVYHDARKSIPGLADLMTVLQSEIRHYSKVYIVVDALDECRERDQRDLITTLQSLAGNINMMVTSRILPSIQQLFQDAKRLDIRANNDDVRRYIEGRIPHENRLARHVGKDRSLQETIVNKIVANVKGM